MPADARVQDKGTVDGRHCWNWRTCSPTALQVYADAEETCPFLGPFPLKIDILTNEQLVS